MQDLNQDIYNVCHGSDLEVKEIAFAMGLGYQIFVNKANPNNDSSHFSVNQIVQLQKITGCNLITTTMQALLRAPPDREERLEDLCIQSFVEHAEAIKALDATRDGKPLTPRQRTVVRREIAEAHRALHRIEDWLNAHDQPMSSWEHEEKQR